MPIAMPGLPCEASAHGARVARRGAVASFASTLLGIRLIVCRDIIGNGAVCFGGRVRTQGGKRCAWAGGFAAAGGASVPTGSGKGRGAALRQSPRALNEYSASIHCKLTTHNSKLETQNYPPVYGDSSL